MHIGNREGDFLATFVSGRIPIPDGVNRAVLKFRFLHVPVNRLEVNRDAEFLRHVLGEFDIKAGIVAIFLLEAHRNKGIIETDRDDLLLLVFIPVIDFWIACQLRTACKTHDRHPYKRQKP